MEHDKATMNWQRKILSLFGMKFFSFKKQCQYDRPHNNKEIAEEIRITECRKNSFGKNTAPGERV